MNWVTCIQGRFDQFIPGLEREIELYLHLTGQNWLDVVSGGWKRERIYRLERQSRTPGPPRARVTESNMSYISAGQVVYCVVLILHLHNTRVNTDGSILEMEYLNQQK